MKLRSKINLEMSEAYKTRQKKMHVSTALGDRLISHEEGCRYT